MIKKYWLVTVLLGGVTVFTSCSDDENDVDSDDVTPENVVLEEDATLGSYLTDKDGMSLYYFTEDVDGTSQCVDGCLSSWPVFYEQDIQPSSALSTADFGVITKGDGSKQTTYKGWPLYYFSGDTEKGDLEGEGVGSVWYVAKPDYTVMVADFEVGDESEKFLVDAEGNTLYVFTNDEEDVSNCEGGCVDSWPLFFSDEIIVPSLLSSGDFSTITREDGSDQLSYKGSPLYYYVNDTGRGEANGQGVGGNWFILDLSGE